MCDALDEIKNQDQKVLVPVLFVSVPSSLITVLNAENLEHV